MDASLGRTGRPLLPPLLMLLLLLLLLAASDGLKLSCAPCGVRRAARQGRVVGGRSAYPGQLPWTAQLEWSTGLAGAVIISERHLLTTAHGLHMGYDVSSMTAVIGQHDRHAQSAGKRRVRVDKVTLQNFNVTTLENDLALVHLQQPITWDQFAQPICLPDSDPTPAHPEAEVTAIVAGWGLLRESSNSAEPVFAEVLQLTEVPIISRTRCLQWFSSGDGESSGDVESSEEGGGRMPLTDTQLCAGYRDGGHDSCLGDSGGPLVVETGGRFTLVGVVSYGNGCGRRKSPGIYTNVFKYRRWIQDKMAEQEAGRDKASLPGGGKDEGIGHPAEQTETTEETKQKIEAEKSKVAGV